MFCACLVIEMERWLITRIYDNFESQIHLNWIKMEAQIMWFNCSLNVGHTKAYKLCFLPRLELNRDWGASAPPAGCILNLTQIWWWFHCCNASLGPLTLSPCAEEKIITLLHCQLYSEVDIHFQGSCHIPPTLAIQRKCIQDKDKGRR